MLYNLHLTRQNGEIFPVNTPVSLYFEMDADKILRVKAKAIGEEWEAKCENPLDNAAMTDGEAKVMKAQRAAYISAENNNHRPTSSALDALCRAYEDNNQEFLAGETLEERIQYYPDASLYNRIGVLFHNSGVYNRAIAYFRKAVKRDPNNTTALNNLGHDLYLIGEIKEAREYVEKAVNLRGDYAIALVVLARIEAIDKNEDKSKEYLQRAFNIFTRRWKSNDLDDCEKGWFKSVANELNEKETCNQLTQELRNSTQSKGYSLENTLFGSHDKI